MITITAERATAVDFSWPYMEETAGLLSHRPGYLPKWQALFWPFDTFTWLAVLVALIGFPIGLFIALKIASLFIPLEGNNYSVYECFVESLKIFLRERELLPAQVGSFKLTFAIILAVVMWPCSWEGKLLLQLWWFAGFILTAGILSLHSQYDPV